MNIQQAYSRKSRLLKQLHDLYSSIRDEEECPVHNKSYLANKLEWVKVIKGELYSLDKTIGIIEFENRRLSLMQELLNLKIIIADYNNENFVTEDKALKEQYKDKLRIFMKMNEISIKRDRYSNK